MTPSASSALSLLDKYPHLRLLAARRKEDVAKHGAGSENHEVVGDGKEDAVSGRISLLGPGPGLGRRKSSEDGTANVVVPAIVPRTRVVAEELFAASVAADDDQWLQFQVEAAVPARQQLDQLKLWLVANRPSTIARSSGVGWIAVKFKDKGKKVLEAKAAWDSHEGEKTMEVVNELATEFQVMGGKWMCHLPSGLIDEVWTKLATTLMCGGLGPSVYMVKVSPVEDIDPNLARGEHVICVYNTDYKDTEQVMRVENLMRSAGVATQLNYKPDIFSALGIYRNNKWGFRPTIYSSRVMMMEGKSKVETVGTGKWYYNSSKGLQYPDGGLGQKEASQDKEKNVKEVGNRSELGKKLKDERQVLSQKLEPSKIPDDFCLETMDSMKNMDIKAPIISTPGLNSLCMESLDKMKSTAISDAKSCSQETKHLVHSNKENSGPKTSWSHRLTAKKHADYVKETLIVNRDDLLKEKVITAEGTEAVDVVKEKKQVNKSWSHRLAAKHENNAPITCSEEAAGQPEGMAMRSKGIKAKIMTAKDVKTVENIGKINDKVCEVKGKQSSQSLKNKESLSKNKSLKVESVKESAAVKKPAWLKKLEELKMKNLNEMKTS